MSALRWQAAFALVASVPFYTIVPETSADPFTPGNVLVTSLFTLREYAPNGTLVQEIQIPRRSTDTTVDRFGRAHVLSTGAFLNVYDPFLDSWSEIPILGTLGNVADGDISILGDTLYTSRARVSVLDGSVRQYLRPEWSAGEANPGLDGLLYTTGSGSPRAQLTVWDPDTLAYLREVELLSEEGDRLTARGIAVAADGTIYALDLHGTIYVYDHNGVLLESHATTVRSSVDLDLSHEGLLVASGADGQVYITDVSFETSASFRVVTSFPVHPAYVAPVPTHRERPDADADGVLDFSDDCPGLPNTDQDDADADGLGDACDPYPDDPDNLPICLVELDETEASVVALELTRNALLEEVEVLVDERAFLLAEIERLRARVDSDADGVPDARDECPGTRRPGWVDSEGCSVRQRWLRWLRWQATLSPLRALILPGR
jgi:hypothetical protein